ncbi:MAG: prepilin-type N-terminal cleavage/methylation domain-containing protein [Candidatus Methylomirabilales bacterium]
MVAGQEMRLTTPLNGGNGGETSRGRFERGRGLRSRSGFTLIEILIAMAVLTVGLLGVASLYPVAYVNVDAGGKLTEATALAQSFLEQLRTIGATDFDGMAGPFPAQGFNGMSTDACAGNAICVGWGNNLDVANGGQLPQGVGTVTITCQDGGGAPQPCTPSQAGWLATLNVTVNWIDLRGQRTMTLTSRAARP